MNDATGMPPRRGPAAARRDLLRIAAALAAAHATAARAQAFPTPGRPVRLVLPSGAGGGADLFGRLMAEWLSKELGTQVVVDNRPGAARATGTGC